MFRAPMDSFHFDRMSEAGRWVEPLLSEEALRRTGYFEPAEVARWRRDFKRLRPGSIARTSIEMGLVGVTATQLWHHTYIEPLYGSEALAVRSAECGVRNEEGSAVRTPQSALRT
jgi:asparagine synthase (glutamine-hydrolysing)